MDSSWLYSLYLAELAGGQLFAAPAKSAIFVAFIALVAVWAQYGSIFGLGVAFLLAALWWYAAASPET